MATVKFSVGIEETTYNKVKNIVKKTNFTLSEIINATLFDFVNKDITSQYHITSDFKWLKRHDEEMLKELKEE
jgi:hypothetical protein